MGTNPGAGRSHPSIPLGLFQDKSEFLLGFFFPAITIEECAPLFSGVSKLQQGLPGPFGGQYVFLGRVKIK